MTFKQKSLQAALPFWFNSRLFAVLCCSCIVAGAWGMTPASAQGLGDKSGERTADLRLIDSGGLKDGRYGVGIEISMAPAAHTYWKMPGDAGVPPVFTFNGSENVAAAEALFPAPIRIVEDGLQAFGYTGMVVFPVRVTPADPARPAILHADVTYAVCEKICMPAHGMARITLSPTGAAVAPEPLAQWTKRVPTPITAGERADLAIVRDQAAKKPTWTLTWTGKTPVADMFADAPEGFYFDTRKLGPTTWSLTESQGVTLPSGKVPVSLTLARQGGDALLVTEKLDAAASIQ